MERYFTRTYRGQQWAEWIVPSPLFVASDMVYPVQVADLCIYCINWAFRGEPGMVAPVRQEIADAFGEYFRKIQWQGDVETGGEHGRDSGIIYEPEPYSGKK